MAVIVVIVVVVALLIDAGAIASLVFQRSVRVKVKPFTYRVRLTPTGVHWVSWGDFDLSWFQATPRWIQHVRHRPRTWTVAVTDSWAGYSDPALLSEDLQSWQAARDHVQDLARRIESGELGFGHRPGGSAANASKRRSRSKLDSTATLHPVLGICRPSPPDHPDIPPIGRAEAPPTDSRGRRDSRRGTPGRAHATRRFSCVEPPGGPGCSRLVRDPCRVPPGASQSRQYRSVQPMVATLVLWV